MSTGKIPRLVQDRGVAVVEFALVLPVFLSLVLGMFTGGMVMNRQLDVTHAAREGARHGAMLPPDQTFASGTWATNVRDVVVRRSEGKLRAADVCVALVDGVTPVPVSSAHTTRSDGRACFDDTAEGLTSRRVQVDAATSGKLEAFFFSRQIPITARVTARHEPLA